MTTGLMGRTRHAGRGGDGATKCQVPLFPVHLVQRTRVQSPVKIPPR
jgi:hypothetical protein